MQGEGKGCRPGYMHCRPRQRPVPFPSAKKRADSNALAAFLQWMTLAPYLAALLKCLARSKSYFIRCKNRGATVVRQYVVPRPKLQASQCSPAAAHLCTQANNSCWPDPKRASKPPVDQAHAEFSSVYPLMRPNIGMIITMKGKYHRLPSGAGAMALAWVLAPLDCVGVSSCVQ